PLQVCRRACAAAGVYVADLRAAAHDRITVAHRAGGRTEARRNEGGWTPVELNGHLSGPIGPSSDDRPGESLGGLARNFSDRLRRRSRAASDAGEEERCWQQSKGANSRAAFHCSLFSKGVSGAPCSRSPLPRRSIGWNDVQMHGTRLVPCAPF